jgi:signal transduction histidine kinase
MEGFFRVPAHHELDDRVRWLIQFRWLFVAGAVVLILIGNAALPNTLPLVHLFAVTAGLALCNLGLYLYTRRLAALDSDQRYPRALRIAYLQIALDLASLTLLVHFSGGLENPFLFYYVLVAISASVLLSAKASFGFAGLAIVLFLGMLILEATGVIPHYNLRGYRIASRYAEPIHVVSVSIVLSSMVLLTTYFASSVVASLRKRTQELMESNLAYELRTAELAEANRSCELRAGELAEANRSCELRAGELAELNVRLKELDDARMQFTLLVTHELRAPVAAIHSYLKLILEGYVPPERQQEILQRSATRAREQLDLIADLLELGKIQQRGLNESKSTVQMEEVLSSVIDALHTWANDKSIRLLTEIAPDLPPVMMAPNHVKQLWMNLVSNAIKYTKPGGTVTVYLRREGQTLVGAVQDTGIGISAQDQSRIFQEFYRTDEAKAMEQQGTGLGLSIVKRIVEINGGQISLQSEVGVGSTFTFILPLPDAA